MRCDWPSSLRCLSVALASVVTGPLAFIPAATQRCAAVRERIPGRRARVVCVVCLAALNTPVLEDERMKLPPPVPGRREPCRKRLQCDDCVAGLLVHLGFPLAVATDLKGDEAPRSTPDQARVARHTQCCPPRSAPARCPVGGWDLLIAADVEASVPSSTPGGPRPHGAVVLQPVPPSRQGPTHGGPRGPKPATAVDRVDRAGCVSAWGGAPGGRRPGRRRRTGSRRRARPGGGAARAPVSRASGRRWSPGRGPARPSRR
jgi:hypothetical protein